MLGAYFIVPLVLQWRRRETVGPRLLRSTLEELGGTWVKLGQALALRFDLLPSNYCYELFKLLNQMQPFSFQQAREIIREDLGSYPEQLFQSIEEKPFAAASIGQVHRAVLHTGEKVAVKVQRPKIALEINADIRLMYLVAPLADWFRLMGATKTRDIIDEFGAWTLDELDYRVEAHHAGNLAANAQDDPFEQNAGVHLNLSARRVMTMQLIEGIPLIDILYAVRNVDAAFLAELKADGYHLYTIAEHLTWNLLNQLYRFGYFHADLHPANLFVLPGNAIGYVDFGIVGNVSVEVRDSLAQYASHLYQGRIDRATEEFMRWVYPSAQTNIRDARRELIRIIDEYLFQLRSRVAGREGASSFEVDFLNAIRRHQMGLHPDIAIYLKALMTANAVIFELAPNYDLQRTENLFFSRLIREELASLLEPGRASMFLYDYSYRIRRALESLEKVERSGEEVGTAIRGVQSSIRRWLFLAVAMFVAFWLVATPGRSHSVVNEYLGPSVAAYLPYAILGAFALSIIRALQQSRRLAGTKRLENGGARLALRSRWEQRPRTG